MAVRISPLPLNVFPEAARPFIARLNRELRDLSGLEGTISQPRDVRRSDLSIARRETTQVAVSRITPSIASVVSGVSTVIGIPALTFGLTNVVGTSTSAVSVDSSIALFSTVLPETIGTTSATGSDAFAARRGHAHGTQMTATGSLLTRDASVLLDLPVGTNSQVLTADSTETSGLSWTTPVSQLSHQVFLDFGTRNVAFTA